MDSIGEYLTQTCSRDPLSKEETQYLAALTRHGHAYVRRWARDRLVEANMRLVAARAKRYRWSGIPYRDLMQRGVIGLLRAIDMYDAQRGSLSTYASWWIDAKIQRLVDNQATMIRQPVDRRRQALQVARAARKLAQRRNREPTPRELCEETGIERHHLDRITLTGRTVSLDEVLSEPDGDALMALIGDDGVDVEGEAEVAALWEVVLSYISQLGEHSRQYPVVLVEYYLLDRTLDEIGEEWGCSRQYVGSVKQKAEALLRWLCSRDDGLEALEETWRTRDCALHNAGSVTRGNGRER